MVLCIEKRWVFAKVLVCTDGFETMAILKGLELFAKIVIQKHGNYIN